MKIKMPKEQFDKILKEEVEKFISNNPLFEFSMSPSQSDDSGNKKGVSVNTKGKNPQENQDIEDNVVNEVNKEEEIEEAEGCPLPEKEVKKETKATKVKKVTK